MCHVTGTAAAASHSAYLRYILRHNRLLLYRTTSKHNTAAERLSNGIKLATATACTLLLSCSFLPPFLWWCIQLDEVVNAQDCERCLRSKLRGTGNKHSRSSKSDHAHCDPLAPEDADPNRAEGVAHQAAQCATENNLQLHGAKWPHCSLCCSSQPTWIILVLLRAGSSTPASTLFTTCTCHKPPSTQRTVRKGEHMLDAKPTACTHEAICASVQP